MDIEKVTRSQHSNGGSHPVVESVAEEAASNVAAEAEPSPRPVAYWLLVCCAMIYMMVVIGGVTRLTRSGLSMVEWKPILGAIPPMSKASWEQAFAKYKAYPEYKVRRDMTLSGFKRIYLVEYFHRLFGRLIGVVFFLPLLFFWLRKRLRKAWVPWLVGLFVLGGLQGVLGWYMVKSGLINIPRVSPYRLTAHLGLAVFLYAGTLWMALRLLGWNVRFGPGLRSSDDGPLVQLRGWVWGLIAVIGA